MNFPKQLKSGNTIKAMTVYDQIPVKSTKAEQQYQHGIINVKSIRYDGQNSHRAHDLTEEKDTINKYNSIYFHTLLILYRLYRFFSVSVHV